MFGDDDLYYMALYYVDAPTAGLVRVICVYTCLSQSACIVRDVFVYLARYYVHVCGHTLQRGRLGTLLLPSLMLSLVHLRLFYTVSQLVMRTH